MCYNNIKFSYRLTLKNVAKENKKLKIGLALGAGGARGLAHIGVLKVLERNNIPIDFISGTSIGSIIGALYAVIRNANELEKIITTADWRLFLSLLDPSLAQGLLRGEKIKKFLIKFLGEKAVFKDLKIPFTAVATDFSTGQPVIMNKGELVEAIMASSAVPLIFQPIKKDGKVLVDGSLSMPVPIEPLKQSGAEAVIAVNLDDDYFSQKKEKLNLGETAFQAIKLLRYQLAERDSRVADVVIAPMVGEINGYNFLAGTKAIAAGEKAAQKVLPEIKKLF